MGLFSIFWLGARTNSAVRPAGRAVAPTFAPVGFGVAASGEDAALAGAQAAAISSGTRAPVMKATASDMV
jgi:hypothetical protein